MFLDIRDAERLSRQRREEYRVRWQLLRVFEEVVPTRAECHIVGYLSIAQKPADERVTKSVFLRTGREKWYLGEQTILLTDRTIPEVSNASVVSQSNRSQFVTYESALIILGFAIAAQVSPPDVYSQVLATLVVLVITLPLSYWLAYRRQ
ncbi:DUF7534 family protein [Halobellus inordinatus]|uniref:DUF7534 family protein n=1 Tax=Halobellus inordinatus TaxID=1126236 RepID=UPI003CCD021F